MKCVSTMDSPPPPYFLQIDLFCTAFSYPESIKQKNPGSLYSCSIADGHWSPTSTSFTLGPLPRRGGGSGARSPPGGATAPGGSSLLAPLPARPVPSRTPRGEAPRLLPVSGAAPQPPRPRGSARAAAAEEPGGKWALRSGAPRASPFSGCDAGLLGFEPLLEGGGGGSGSFPTFLCPSSLSAEERPGPGRTSLCGSDVTPVKPLIPQAPEGRARRASPVRLWHPAQRSGTRGSLTGGDRLHAVLPAPGDPDRKTPGGGQGLLD